MESSVVRENFKEELESKKTFLDESCQSARNLEMSFDLDGLRVLSRPLGFELLKAQKISLILQPSK